MDDTQKALAIIDSIYSVTDTDELQKLEAGLNALFQLPSPERGIETLFRLYERFPDDDGYGVFWTVLHGLEHLPGYEPYLKASVRRIPTEFNVLMVNRILNSNLSGPQRQEWLTLLEEAKANPNASETASTQATHFIEYQNSRLQ